MTDPSHFTHFDTSGDPQMVDVSQKPDTSREATACAYVRMNRTTRESIHQQAMKKGDVLAVAELAGIMAAKRTSDFIPLCHPLPITKVSVKGSWVDDGDESDSETALLELRATVKTTYKTGVEMEALTASSVAALTVYDMCKSVDRAMTIERVGLIHKSGGKSGTFERSL